MLLITSNSVQSLRTAATLPVSVQISGIMQTGRIFTKKRYAMTASSKRPSNDRTMLIRLMAMNTTYVYMHKINQLLILNDSIFVLCYSQ